MNYRVRRRINPLSPTKEAKYYARPEYNGVSDIRDIMDRLSDASTLTHADVRAVVEGLLQLIPEQMKRGEVVKVGELGNFKIGFTSQGKDNPNDITARDIEEPYIIFTPSKEFKKAIKDVEITKGKTPPKTYYKSKEV